MDAANRQLTTYRLLEKPDRQSQWSKAIIQFLLGQSTEEEFLRQAAKVPASGKRLAMASAANYFIASKRLVNGNKEGALEYFKKCVAGGGRGNLEFRLAAIELSHLANP